MERGFPEEEEELLSALAEEGPNDDDEAMAHAIYEEDLPMLPQDEPMPHLDSQRDIQPETLPDSLPDSLPAEDHLTPPASPERTSPGRTSPEPAEGALFHLSDEGGRTCTLRQRVQPARGRRSDRAALNAACIGGASITRMIEAIEREAIVSAKTQPAPPANETPAAEKKASASASSTSKGSGTRGGALWVDRYAPRAFTQLLSDERVNRAVLRWVKSWDAHVFGVRPSGSGRNRVSASAPNGNGAGEWNPEGPVVDDPFARPDRQLLLLSGPPGLGKTTLVQVVARHCGYRVLEINASDERASKVVKQRVKEASEAQNVYAGDRPVLILLDEIDGAMGGSEGAGTINELIKLASPSATTGGLHRPVICVCNDVYAPALRPLRAFAELCEFRSANNNSQLALRLRTICEREGLGADEHTLSKLCERAQGDVRTCINTLQFVRAKTRQISNEELEKMPVGKKDVGKQVRYTAFFCLFLNVAHPFLPHLKN